MLSHPFYCRANSLKKPSRLDIVKVVLGQHHLPRQLGQDGLAAADAGYQAVEATS